MAPHRADLVRKLQRVQHQIEMAIQDAAEGEDLSGAIAHAEIGRTLLQEIVSAKGAAA